MKTAPGTLATNRKAFRDYVVLEKIEAGIQLQGTEVKSVRNRRLNMNDAFARVQNGEVFLHNLHISPYEQGNRFNHDPVRVRKLLLKRGEISRLIGQTERKGFALIPLTVYFKKNLVKVELALAKGKKEFDRREDIKRRDDELEMQRAFRHRNR